MPNPSAISAARTVLQTGSEFFADLLTSATFAPKAAGLAPEFLAALAAPVRTAAEREGAAIFESLLQKDFAPKVLQSSATALESLAGKATAEIAGSAAIETGVAEGAAIVGRRVGGALVSLGLTLLLEAERFVIDRVRMGRINLALTQAGIATGGIFFGRTLDLIHDMFPIPDPQSEPVPSEQFWPEPDRKKHKGEKRYRRMQRRRVRG